MNPTSNDPTDTSESHETGFKEEKIDLPDRISENKKTESDLLPHERDETTGPTGTNAKGSEKSRDVIKRAHDDTKHDLKDTDRRGIPSDIDSSK